MKELPSYVKIKRETEAFGFIWAQVDKQHRWGSTYEMLEIPRAATSYLCYAVEDGDDRTLMPSTDENATKEKLVEILKHLSSYRDFKWRIISNHWCSIPNIKLFSTVLLVSDCNDKNIAN